MPRLEPLEDRTMPDVSGVLAGGVLTITATPNTVNRIDLSLDPSSSQIVLQDFSGVQGIFPLAQVQSITINAGGKSNYVSVAPNIFVPTTIQGGPGNNRLLAGGGNTTIFGGQGPNYLAGGAGNDTLVAGPMNDVLAAGTGTSSLVAGAGRDIFLGSPASSTIVAFNPALDHDLRGGTATPASVAATDQLLGLTPSPSATLTSSEVNTLLQRAAAATASDDGIVAIVDRSGRILGVRVEQNVSPAITGNTEKLVFAIDGAVAEARTGAFFGNDQAPLTSRTIQYISQTTNTQRMVESDPSITDPNSTVAGPGTVGPVGIGGHFPPNVPFTPQVDLFAIEETNRDTSTHGGTTPLPERFNIDPNFIPSSIPVSEQLAAPDSYGYASGIEPNAQPRGIGTMPGGIPIYKTAANGQPVVVGGIGVFFPGQTGYADAENSALQSNYDPTKPDRSLEAEYVAFAAVGGAPGINIPIGVLGGVAPLPEISYPLAPGVRIDLVGITLPLIGPPGADGVGTVVHNGQTLGIGNPNSSILPNGANEPLIDPTMTNNKINPFLPNNVMATALNGTLVPEGFLVTPHTLPGDSLTAADVMQMIQQGVAQALQTRAAIRFPQGVSTSMVVAVSDPAGNVLGLFRMPDSTIFSIDVAVAKSRNVSYYANPALLQPQDQVPGVPPGTALTNRTFRYLVEPRFPEGIDGDPPGPFSILNDGGTDPKTGLNVGPPLPASAFQSVQGHDAFNPQTNFRDPLNPLNQDGIVFFPGSVPVYTNGTLAGGAGISGDGVDQDDVVTFSTFQGFPVPPTILRADQTFVRGVRLPYQKFNRQPNIP